ncbi:MAG: hypothetical protein K0S38_498 [Candidatus Paceibacter sp.]|jgi:hypothetical protein|nr:hypothetical protein [Candidatus Paceibacter sp.]
MSLSTQLSSKYSPDNMPLFKFKELLLRAGLTIDFPVGATIIEYKEEFAITVTGEGQTPFQETQQSFFDCVKSNPLHLVYNIYGSIDGYIGESATVETAYALVCKKPVVLIRNMLFGPKAPRSIVEIIEKRRSKLYVLPLDALTAPEVLTTLEGVVKSTPKIDYRLTRTERNVIKKEMVILLEKYYQAWTRYFSSKHP